MGSARSATNANSTSKSNATLVGGGVGGAIAAISTQITDPVYRNLVTVAAPVIAVILTSVYDASALMIRNWWHQSTQSYHEKKTTEYARKILKHPDSSAEVKEKALKAIANAQIATLEFHESNLNMASQQKFTGAGKRNQIAAAPNQVESKTK